MKPLTALMALMALMLLPLLGANEGVVTAQTKPFALPFDTPPGPGTWLLSQQYGNTLGAFNFGRYWYAGGQNLHLHCCGADTSVSCPHRFGFLA